MLKLLETVCKTAKDCFFSFAGPVASVLADGPEDMP